ncbi:zinc finger protein 277 [Anoplophora glabripennis]|uniref:Zinc finger protein n=1 Tax=Anoplophora glabripennis TaxID=217634 RepID=V5H2E9_ANOGL|nr:zinc finger protein 277 [Anoplophora glabripennis]XP_018562001.1 zinc finger protein 277 [Anoplophora glabripennis]XP_018562002.1 zinc finger protein 277 [Anoplophora glabripennis]
MANISLKDHASEMFGPLTFQYSHTLESAKTRCLLCEEVFDLGLSVRSFLKHIFEAHNIVIDDVQNIEKLPEYISYWRDRFRTTPLEAIIPSLNMDCTGYKYFLLSALLKEDKKLRHKLKLEHVLNVQEFERNDKHFIKPCLFCRLEFEGTRHGYLEHISMVHNILLGNPQNLVYIEELVEKLDKQMKDLKCIYCEKTFPDRTILKEHMRKKLHKRINPSTTDYDKYYIVNYLEPDKTWRDIEKEDDRYAVPAGVEPNADEEYSDWCEQDDFITCLFCQVKDRNIYVLCIHMDGDHDFDFLEQTENLDFYQKIKLVNYIRKQVHNNKCVFCDLPCGDSKSLQKHFLEEKHCRVPDLKVFDQPEFFFPTYENDAFLYYVEDLETF